jgi:DNA invertase Pin-like site-specific DNA recombinase
MAHKTPQKPRLFAYIRWSSDKQTDGDSKRRQTELAHAYAVRNGLELRGGDILVDEGISAFTGTNATSGQLGGFLDRVRAKQIPPGSILLIEAFDRLSRQAPLKSLRIFSEILDAGIKLVTLQDGQEYSDENSDQIEKLFLPLLSFGTSNQESAKKKIRLRSMWEEKRARAGSEKITRMCPGWLKAKGDGKDFSFVLRADRVKIVRWIFEQSVAGFGNYAICRILNGKGTPSFKMSKNGDGKWVISSIQKILQNRAVLGEFQPHKRIDGKKISEGEAIRDYYPTIIDQGLFDRAAQARRARLSRDSSGKKQPKGGRKGANLPNLFTGIAMRCIYCAAPMYRRDKSKRSVYFVCSAADRGIGCETTQWSYKHFETSFLAHVEEIDLEHLTRSEEENAARVELQGEIDKTKTRLGGIEVKMEALMDAASVPMVAKKLKDLEAERIELLRTIATQEDRLGQMASEAKLFYQSRDEIKSLVALLQTGNGRDDLFRLRVMVNAKLKTLVASIHLATVGAARKPTRTFSVEQQTNLALGVPGDAGRFFQVMFTNGDDTIIFPDKDPYAEPVDEFYSGAGFLDDDDED